MFKEYIEREAVVAFIENMAASQYLIQCFKNKEHFPAADVEPVRHAHWTGMEGDTCSECLHNLTEIMDADSYFAIGFNPNDLVACPFCGAKMDGGNE
jgi:hypothetical protein